MVGPDGLELARSIACSRQQCHPQSAAYRARSGRRLGAPVDPVTDAGLRTPSWRPWAQDRGWRRCVDSRDISSEPLASAPNLVYKAHPALSENVSAATQKGECPAG